MPNLSVHRTKFLARTSAVTTTGAVDSAVLNLNQTLDGWVQVYIDFTVGSLTNCTFDTQLNDGSGWYSVSTPGALVLTASAAKAFAVNGGGAKQLKVVVTGSGTVTNSLAAIKFGYRIAGGAV